MLCAVALAHGAELRQRPPQDEAVYFLLPDRFENGDASNDRGGLSGGRLVTGFDPSDKGFYHGGDLKGLMARLDYIQGLGATAVWVGPVFKNKAVQGPPGAESAGYHGYWITDFTRVDPHFGSNADFKALVEALHARGMKLYMDIVANHTADVIRYRECPAAPCPYRSRADFPYQRRGGLGGEPINAGFGGDDAAHQTPENFAQLRRPDYAYTPYVPAGEEHLKVPEWLNDPIYYHNRGDSTFSGESSTFGDFAGLDDLMTENPRVLRGFIDIYGRWIDDYGVDGFRIDTARHVNPEFWQAFVPAMLARARARGIPNFHIFGEINSAAPDAAALALHTRVDHLPAVLDFAFRNAVRDTLAGAAGTQLLTHVFEQDALYEGGAATALQLPTFISNHDEGRFAHFVRAARPQASDAEVLQRVLLAHAMLFTLRGVPVVYYGDEQGFAGTGGDQAARQDMFASRVASYNAERLLGSGGSTVHSNFDAVQPLYRAIARLAALRQAQPALRRGLQQVRADAAIPGAFVVSRFDPDSGTELVIGFNTSTAPVTVQVAVNAASVRFAALAGHCTAAASAPGSYRLELPPLDYVVCAAQVPP
ncbi:MAG TPA: alpha-amylase family glycosyl hydrolase [Candidatus Dormibacteraeota bacterium]|nr:alpha-amylase family glycosyl hydrolase [Candidatus Dormibacteraeota bacterium]